MSLEFDCQGCGKRLRLADEHAGAYADPHFGPAVAQGTSVKAIATGVVGDRLQAQSDRVIWVLGAIPLGALLVAVLGVANAIGAGVRARAWEFGVLRANGLEGRGAGRLVIAEALVMAAAATLLAIGIGIPAAWSGIGVSVQAFNAGGEHPGLIVPWLDIVIAAAITTAVAVLAALAPALRLGRRQPLELLQAGRAAG